MRFHLNTEIKGIISILVCVFFLIMPPLLLLCYVDTFAVNVIHWDDWQNVFLVQKAMNGTLSFSDLYVLHNEHRMPFPNLFMAVIEILTQYNTVAVKIFSWVFICLTALFIFAIYRRQFKWNSYPRLLLAFLPVSLLLFSLRQWESILLTVTFQIYMMIFGVVAAFSLLERSKKMDIWFGSGLLSAILASFSFFAGLAVWPVGFLQIVISRRRSGLRQITLWIVVSIGALISYFWGYVKPGSSPPVDYVFSHPMVAVGYFFASVGSPLFWGSGVISGILGLAIILIAVSVLVCAYREKILGKNCVWLSLILFAAFFSLFITVSRSGFGVEQALTSRYTPVTSLGGIGIYLLALPTLRRHFGRSRQFIAYGLLALIVIGIISAYLLGFYGGLVNVHSSGIPSETEAYVLLTYKMQSDGNMGKYLFVDTVLVKNAAEFLEENRLSVFSKPIVDTSKLTLTYSRTSYELEGINGEPTLGQGTDFAIDSHKYDTINITGWAVDKQANSVASAVFIIIDDEIHIPVMYGLDRSDVANYLMNSNFRFSGFLAMFSPAKLGVGKHSVSLEIVSKSGYYYYESRVLYLIVS